MRVYCGDARITVLDRETGWGYGVRDIESGYKDEEGKFWLASGNFDIRCYCDKYASFKEAAELIKRNANTCRG